MYDDINYDLRGGIAICFPTIRWSDMLERRVTWMLIENGERVERVPINRERHAWVDRAPHSAVTLCISLLISDINLGVIYHYYQYRERRVSCLRSYGDHAARHIIFILLKRQSALHDRSSERDCDSFNIPPSSHCITSSSVYRVEVGICNSLR